MSAATHSLPSRLLRRTLSGAVGPFSALWQNRDLVRVLIRREMAVRASGTSIGAVWMVLQPALQVLAFWFLLDIVLRVRLPAAVSFVDYFLVGMLAWLFVAEVLNRSLTVLEEFQALYRRSPFPVVILPVLPLLVSVAVHGFVYLIAVALLHGPAATAAAGVWLLLLAIWLVPICYLFALLGVFLRDFMQVAPFVITMTMYVTPILYMPEQVPEAARAFLTLNPFADLFAAAHGLIQGLPWEWGHLLRPAGLWLLLAGPAWVLFHRMQPHIREAL